MAGWNDDIGDGDRDPIDVIAGEASCVGLIFFGMLLTAAMLIVCLALVLK